VTDPAKLRLSLGGSPPAVTFSRGAVPDDAWYRIVLLFGDSIQRMSASFTVPPEQLLHRKRGLQSILKDHRVGLEPDDGALALLRESLDDATALADARHDRPRPIGDPVMEVLTLRRQLRPFQLRDLERLGTLKHGANFSVPGAGKTTVTYAVHAQARNAGLVTKLLVVAPYSAFSAWEEDAEEVLNPAPRVTRWRPTAPQPTGDVVLVAYPQLPAAAPHLIEWMLTHRTHLVADEAHRAKRGVSGEWGRALASMAAFASRRDILTGTPAPNHPRDLARLLELLWPGTNAPALLPDLALRNNPPPRAMTAVQQAIAPLYVRTTKAELELPDVKIVRETVPMSDLQGQIYAAMRRQYAGALALDTRDQRLLGMKGEVLIYLLQAASNPRLLGDAIGPRAYRHPPLAVPEGSRLAGLIETYDQHEMSAKLQVACRIVETNASNDLKTLVWSNFPGNLRDLEQQFAGLQPAIVYGGVSTDLDDPRSRDREVARFKNDDNCKVLLANPAAMSEGVSLHHVCHDAVYIDRTFNAGQYLQSLDRIHRLGLENDVETRVTLLVAAGTLDERVDSRVEAKTTALSRMLADPALVAMALPDENSDDVFYDDEADLAEVLDHLMSGPSNADEL
jgi:SNF2 family DNA or RNA helicase